LQLGQTELGGSTLTRKAILVFTDGIENTTPLIATVEPAILAAGTEIYAIGLGRPEDISADALGRLAASSNGRFFLSDDPLILRKNFVQVLADAFRQNMAADPVHQIGKRQVIEVPVWITRCERRISFVLGWDNPASQLALEVIAPDGTVFTPTAGSTNQLVRYGQQPTYRYYQIALPPIDPGSGSVIGPQQLGRWLMRIDGTGVAGQSERCTTSVLVESSLEMKSRVIAKDNTSPLELRVSLRANGKPISGAKVRVSVTAPTKPYAQRLKSIARPATIAGLANDVQGFGLIDRAVRLARQSGRALIPTKKRSYDLKGKGGLYALKLPAPLIDGVYAIEINATGKACGGTFQRYASFATFVPRLPDPKQTTVTVTPVATTTTTLTIIPKDSTGTPLGPGLDLAVKTAASTTSSVIDNRDGSYAVHLNWTGGRRPAKATITIGNIRLHAKIPARPRSRRHL
jgi:hypothetical protein